MKFGKVRWYWGGVTFGVCGYLCLYTSPLFVCSWKLGRNLSFQQGDECSGTPPLFVAGGDGRNAGSALMWRRFHSVIGFWWILLFNLVVAIFQHFLQCWPLLGDAVSFDKHISLNRLFPPETNISYKISYGSKYLLRRYFTPQIVP